MLYLKQWLHQQLVTIAAYCFPWPSDRRGAMKSATDEYHRGRVWAIRVRCSTDLPLQSFRLSTIASFGSLWLWTHQCSLGECSRIGAAYYFWLGVQTSKFFSFSQMLPVVHIVLLVILFAGRRTRWFYVLCMKCPTVCGSISLQKRGVRFDIAPIARAILFVNYSHHKNGFPQGSILGPIGCSIYTHPIRKILRDNDISIISMQMTRSCMWHLILVFLVPMKSLSLNYRTVLHK